MSEGQLPEPYPWPELEQVQQPRRQFKAPDWISKQPPVLIGVVAGAFIVLFIVLIMLLRGRPEGDELQPTLDPTVLAQYALPTADAIVMDSGAPQLQVNAPLSLTLKGLEYAILPYQVQDNGEWLYPAGQSGTAVWVYGTIVNFVIGFEQTKSNTALLESLAPGDEITMTTTIGLVYRFGFAGRKAYDPAGPDPFAQTHPGLTLVSLGGADDTGGRLVVHGEYLATKEEAGAGEAAEQSVAIGELAHLGEVGVTVLETSYMYNDPNIPEGWAFFLVDYQIENLTQEVLDPNRFKMELQDGAGNTYSLNLPASQAGAFGFLMLTIPPNTVAQGTAGYLVPAPLQGPELGWSFSRLDAPESVVEVLIDFTSPQETVDPRLLAAVNLSGAELSSDRTLLSVWGTVLNNSEQELAVTMQDVSLAGSTESFMPLRAADPALPWTIQPGSILSFRITFQRPGSAIVTFSVLNQPFEISGLE